MGLLGVSIIVTSVGISEFLSSLKGNGSGKEEASIVTADGFIKKVNFPNVPITAKAAVVYDVARDQILFEKDAEAQLPLASLTKIMVALTARDLLPKDATVTINQHYLNEDGNNGFRDGQKWRLQDILDATLVESSNDGAAAIAGAYGTFQNGISASTTLEEADGPFLEAMNKKAKELGLSQTYFLNATGLDQNLSVSGAYGSAHDIAKLFSYAVSSFPDAFEATTYDSITVSSVGKTLYKVKNTNSVVEEIPGIIASKTGFTDLAGGNLVVMFDAGPLHPITIAILGSSEKGRFDDVKELVSASLRYLFESDSSSQ